MNRQPYERPPRWWSPKPSAFWIRFWRRHRRRAQTQKHRLIDIEVRNLAHVRQPLGDGCGVLITPNHSSHADCHSIYQIADQLGIPIKLIGLGEKMSDLALFDAQTFVADMFEKGEAGGDGDS